MTNRFAAALRGARFALVAVLGIGLAGCVIASKTQLLPESEAVDLLPASFFAFGYNNDGDGKKVAEDAPLEFAQSGHSYVSSDKSMSLLFAPVAGVADTYLMAAVGTDGSIYGIARYRGGFLAIDMILKDADPSGAIEAEKAAGASALANVTVADGGITTEDRAALDQLVRMHLEGRLPMDTLVAWIGEGADAPRPDRIVPDGDFWKAQ